MPAAIRNSLRRAASGGSTRSATRNALRESKEVSSNYPSTIELAHAIRASRSNPTSRWAIRTKSKSAMALAPTLHRRKRDRPKMRQKRRFQVDTRQDSASSFLIFGGMDLMDAVLDRKPIHRR